jgi:hypothetical protein
MRDRPTRVFLKGRLRVEARVRFAHRLLRAFPHSSKLGDVPHEEAALAGRPSTWWRERDRPRRAFPGGGGFDKQPGDREAGTGFFILPLARTSFGSRTNKKAAVPSALTAFVRRRERDRPRRAFPGGGGFEQQPGARFAVTDFFILPLARTSFGSRTNKKAAVPSALTAFDRRRERDSNPRYPFE